jgi:hypothetical protein
MEELRRDGVKACQVRNDELPVLPQPKRVTWLQRSPAALRFKWSGEEQIVDLKWDRVGVVSVGAVALPEWREAWDTRALRHLPAFHKLGDDPTTRDVVRQNLILKLNRPVEAAAKPADDAKSPFEWIEADHSKTLQVHADIVDAARSMWLRVPMSGASYAPAEDSLRFGDAWGFTYLVRDLVASPAAAVTPMTLQFLNGEDIRGLVFLQLEGLNRHTAWHVIKRSLCDSSSPSPEPPAPFTDGGSSSASPAPPTPSTSP